MALKGTERESKNYEKYVGLFTGKVVAVNPNKAELEKLLNTTLENEITYKDVNEENGAKKIILSFWIKANNPEINNLFNVKIFLENTIRVSSTGKTQYINTIGQTSFSDDIDTIPDFIKERKLRKALIGEETLYKFLSSWLSDLDMSSPNTEISLDNIQNLFNNKTTELRDSIENFHDKSIGLLATIRTSAEGKDYQGIYSYEFLPAYAVESYITKGKMYKSLTRLIDKVESVEYPCKDYFEICALHPYSPEKNIVSSSSSPIMIKTKNTQSQSTVSVEQEQEDDNGLPF